MENEDILHVLVVDDDTRIRQLLSKYLRENDFFVSTAKDAAEARELLEDFIFDIIILDVMMPGENGKQLALSIRQSNQIPILMLTAMGEAEDRITGLESGADDYLVKPFEPRELVIRVKKIISRFNIINKTEDIINIGPFNFELKTSKLLRNTTVIPLTSGEAKLLSLLASNLYKIMSRELLAKLCSGINERSIDVQIIRLRNKIEQDPKKPLYLQTIRGEGYVLNG